ncbi:hypothetical protein F751_1117 [Auxenochlorella protothecoides]|uniref:Uncharacterized protein n=1 Tax=Auxenochlorella protothecoides TaxID=3075 RepID=A0A087SCG7_AUXPR|nr:hypothetical protein F751_1117 [Auxenochlorella protothecoides]KFM23421.1 hypothetical protein F751_1117 [Auxenochlorella protothecoides]
MHDLVGAGGVEPVDLLVLLASTENDLPKLEELVAAGADLSVKVTKGAEYSQVITNTASAIPAEVDAQGQMVTMPAPRWKAGMNAAGRKITSLASGLSL